MASIIVFAFEVKTGLFGNIDDDLVDLIELAKLGEWCEKSHPTGCGRNNTKNEEEGKVGFFEKFLIL